jgi:diacylglycerol kinase family enzyme
MAPQLQTTISPTCILNGKSVHLQSALANIASISGEFGVETQVIVTKPDDAISSLVARALSEHRQPVVAGGGDGTVNAVANRLAGTDIALGLLPMGTLNHFAKDAGIPRKS